MVLSLFELNANIAEHVLHKVQQAGSNKVNHYFLKTHAEVCRIMHTHCFVSLTIEHDLLFIFSPMPKALSSFENITIMKRMRSESFRHGTHISSLKIILFGMSITVLPICINCLYAIQTITCPQGSFADFPSHLGILLYNL